MARLTRDIIARRLVVGAAEGAIIVLIYLYLLPALAGQLLSSLGQEAPSPTGERGYLLIMLTIVGLSVASRVVACTIFSPILQSAGNMFGVIYALSYIGSGVIRVENLSVGNGLYMDVSFDISPIVVVFFAFFAAPSVIIPFLSYFTSEHAG